MPIDPNVLSSCAARCAAGMSSIRGRRVQRLVRREFAGAEWVWLLADDAERPAVLGLGPGGAAVCSTDGRGPQAVVLKWRHGAGAAVETGFDLLKDSLPPVATRSMPIAGRPAAALHRAASAKVPAEAAAALAQAMSSLRLRVGADGQRRKARAARAPASS